MTNPRIVSRETWLGHRKSLLAQEKAFTRQQDDLARARRELPLVRVERAYSFDTTEGQKDLRALFDGMPQLVVYHFMFGKDWDQGCPSCSFWADSFNGVIEHLRARNTAFLCSSNAPLEVLQAYRRRMGWRFTWVSAEGSTFSRDFGVTFDDETAAERGYNYAAPPARNEELPGLSVFHTLPDGGIGHSYSCYARGIEPFNAAYGLLDLTARGRDEADLSWPMAWVRRHDEYGQAAAE